MEQKQIDRINELDEERQKPEVDGVEEMERAALRREYIDSVLGNLKGQLDNTYIVDEQGNKIKLQKKERSNMAILSNLEPKRVFEIFEEMCAIPHGSTNTKAISDWCVAFARERGLEYYQDEANNVILIKEASAGYEHAPAVILQGHLDMVCEKPRTAPRIWSGKGWTWRWMEITSTQWAPPWAETTESRLPWPWLCWMMTAFLIPGWKSC